MPSISTRSVRRMDSDETPTTPSAMGNVMQALNQAAIRRKNTGDDELYYEEQRIREQKEEQRRQARIREKTPGRRTAKVRPGDIDGMFEQWVCLS